MNGRPSLTHEPGLQQKAGQPVKGGGPASDSRRTSRLLRLLPSRPDRVHNLLSRETNGAAIERHIMPQMHPTG